MKHKSRKLSPIGTCLAILLVSLIAGCGQSGPLYLPDQTPPITVAPEDA